jgi:hypothetical protein
MSSNLLRTIWAIFRKDLAVWLHNGRNIASTIVPPLTFLLVQALGAAAVGRSPVALVTLDRDLFKKSPLTGEDQKCGLTFVAKPMANALFRTKSW